MTARDEILRRIKGALSDVPKDETPAQVSVPHGYATHADLDRHELIEQFVDRLVDYKAHVRQISAAALPATIATACAERNLTSLVVPTDLPDEWLPANIDIRRDHGLSHAQLEQSDGVLTGCAISIAQTGTIVLDSGALQGRRVISLLPDYHLCVVRAEQIVGLVPEAISALHHPAINERRPITFISGPSATSDIELNRVEGVHGPRTLEVIIVA
jgi:L-lactate dehydrogenase complex protein LldG